MTLQEAFNLAVQHHQAGRLAEAEGIYRQILTQQPEHAGTLNRMGLLAHQLRRPDAAVDLISRAAAIEPANPEYRFNLGLVLTAQGKTAQAIAAYRQSLDLNPNSAPALCNLGIVLQRSGNLTEAISRYRQAIKLDANYPDAYNNLGSALRASDDLSGSIASYQRAIQIRPNDPAAHNNLANVLYAWGDIAGALAACRRGLAIRPDFPQGRWTLGLLLLAQEDFEQGWQEYEWRLKLPRPKHYEFSQPVWTGQPLNGQRILLHAEQGFGDTIQFIRYLPLIARLGGKISVACQPELVSLLARLPEIETCVAIGQPLPDFDVHCPLPSLAWALKTTPATIPATVPYLSADPAAKSRWQSLLPSDGKLKIGLAWRGRVNPDPKRTIPLAALKPLAQLPNVHLISLQKGDPDPDLDPSMNLIDLTEQINDFSDTAALMANLDLILTIDTAVAHLAGAMGTKTWTLLTSAPDWRWRLKGSDCPWYPTMRLFRQKRHNDWPSAIEEVVAALRANA